MIQQIENFLSEQETKRIIEVAEPRIVKSKTLGANAPSDYRVAEDTWMTRDLDMCETTVFRLAKLLNESTEKMELPNFIRYQVGGQYKLHHDFFHPNTDYYEECVRRGGQRKKTALIYLNENFKGGETDFPKLNTRVTPKTGKLVVWDNLDDQGNPLKDSLHAGLPVTEGTKYIVVIWIRERSFN